MELDPVVIEYAQKYFEMHRNVTLVNQDALAFIDAALKQETKYSYIIHDVFTGGAEPKALFTEAFLQALARSLEPQGFIAIVSVQEKNATLRLADLF